MIEICKYSFLWKCTVLGGPKHYKILVMLEIYLFLHENGLLSDVFSKWPY